PGIDGKGTLSKSSAVAVGACVAAAQDDHVFALGGDFFFSDCVTRHSPILLREIVHSEMNAVQLASWHLEGTGLSCATGQDQGIKVGTQLFHRHVESHVGVGLEDNSFFRHQVQPTANNRLFELEIGNTVGEQSADAICSFKHCDRVTDLVQLGGTRQTSGA